VFFFDVGEEAGFEDDFEFAAGEVSDLGGGADVGFDVAEEAALEGADVDHHVDFGGSVVDGALGLDALGGGGGCAEREAGYGADFDFAAIEGVGGVGDPIRVNADAEELVLARLVAELHDISFCGVGAQKGVVDPLGEVHP
jgi:hypothetical protein